MAGAARWKHGYIPLNRAAAESKFHGKVPGRWFPGASWQPEVPGSRKLADSVVSAQRSHEMRVLAAAHRRDRILEAARHEFAQHSGPGMASNPGYITAGRRYQRRVQSAHRAFETAQAASAARYQRELGPARTRYMAGLGTIQASGQPRKVITMSNSRQIELAMRTLRQKGSRPISFKPGALHAQLGVPQGKKIPPAKMAAARAGAFGPKAKRRALFAKHVLTGPKVRRAMSKARAQRAGKYSNSGQLSIQLAAPVTTKVRRRPMPVTSPMDMEIVRLAEGGVRVVHRRSGEVIGTIGKDEVGRYVAAMALGDRKLTPHIHQKAAFAELLGHYNRASTQEVRQPALAPERSQPDIFLATPATSSSAGPRETVMGVSASRPSGGRTAGLTPRGVTIYSKLKAKGFPHPRAMKFAKKAQKLGRKESSTS